MEIEANVWQKVPGTPSVEIFPIIPKANCVSSNCYIFSAPDALVVVDPGASPEQTQQISRILTEALAVARRPVLVFLSHCHQDHSQEAGLELPAGIEIKRFAHQAGVEALKHRDRNLTVAYLYPWNPEICTARFEGILFASSPASEPPSLEFADSGRIELHTEPIAMPDGTTLQRQWLPLGADNRLEIYHTPGHSPCSISLRVGSLLMLGDLPFAANPGVCGLDGWNHADLLRTLYNVDWLMDTPVITVCCPGHGHCVSAQSMREKLRLMEAEASNLTKVPLMEGWLYRATTNRCFNRLRRERFLSLAPVRWILGEQRPDPRPPDALAIAREDLRLAMATLESLPLKERMAFAMYYLDGKEQEEIGRILGHSKGYVCKLIQRAVAQLRDAGWEVDHAQHR